ncbi:hemolysin activation/secretion protein [Reticulomyxa filosa]|uniref:Hemolysin activation/secretion protein n=1 Tax=Reticulomyxa filosa TaxID=46433 RepID=X6MST6_RETFI|nr:hemolysin activation/secretion protein [Reticulomyxa filosa]|eukprot:ETO16869.1 hemolysin activation/secretion protein [Reticulomyxa filosa]
MLAIPQKYIGKLIDSELMNELMLEIQNKYYKDGYLLAKVLPLKNATLSNGILNLEVIEGNFKDIIIVGEFKDHYLTKEYIKKMKQIKPFNTKKFERYAILLEKLPGLDTAVYQIKLGNIASPYADEFITLYIASGKQKGTFSIDTDSYLSKYIGKYSMITGFDIFDPLKLGDKVKIKLGTSAVISRNKSGFFQYEVPLNSEGTLLRLMMSKGYTKPKFHDVRDNLKDISKHLYDKSVNGFIGGKLIYMDAFKGLNYLDGRYLHTINSSFNSANLNKNYNYLELVYFRYQNLPKNFSLILKGSLQQSNDSLPSYERVAFGGSFIGRGYVNSDIAGDKGIGGAIEFGYGNPYLESKIFNSYRGFVFTDLARVKRNGIANI